MSWIIRLLRDRKGAALAEYGLLLAGITMVSLVAVSVLGSKVGGLVGAVASVLPGAWAEQNAPVAVGELLETRTYDGDGDGKVEQRLDMVDIADERSGTARLGFQMGLGRGEEGAHASSHLYQLGSKPNPNHSGGN
jgi:Flp pilus assembly pilin Flp